MKTSDFLVLLFFIAIIGISYGSMPKEFFNSNAVSSELVYQVKNAYLNGVGQGSYDTGSAYQKRTKSCTIVHVQGNLPEPQAALERDLSKKSACNCHCNGLFDCKCTGESGCKNYIAYIINPKTNEELKVGKLQKFRDGQYRISKKFSQNIDNFSKIVIRFDNNIPVLFGVFSDFR